MEIALRSLVAISDLITESRLAVSAVRTPGSIMKLLTKLVVGVDFSNRSEWRTIKYRTAQTWSLTTFWERCAFRWQ